MMSTKDYYIGLDIGTNSVGFAVSDLKYNIIKKNIQALAGVRLFDEAQTAKARRLFRSSRRRIGRRKFRLELLQRIFKEEIEKKDPLFFIRLKESSLWVEDKTTKTKYSLFSDNNFTDKNFFDDFKTIYHLRKHLLENEVSDIRFLYLACHHIVKYRGHFLFNGDFNISEGSGLRDILTSINDKLNDIFVENELAFSLHNEDLDIISKTIKDKSNTYESSYLKNTDPEKENYNKPKLINKKEKLRELLGVNEESPARFKAIVSAMLGDKINLTNIFSDDKKESLYDGFKEQLKDFKFSSAKYEEAEGFAIGQFTNEMELVNLLKEFYYYKTLGAILCDEKYFSKAMVNLYDKHKKDLEMLKPFIRKNYGMQTYSEMFRNPNTNNNYPSYIGSNFTNGKKEIGHSQIVLGKADYKNNSCPAHCNYEDFLEYLKKVLKDKEDKLKDDETYKKILEEIENKTFLRRLNTEEQAVVPYQLNLQELKAILEKQKAQFEFLTKIKDGFLGIDKIVSLLTFRIPYFIGPLNDAHNKFSWIVKNEGFEKCEITPWNYRQAVNEAESGEKFIERMKSKCSCLQDCDVIPKQSLLYQEYLVLQDLNNLKINGNRITQELKTLLFDNLMQNTSSLSKKKIKDFLIKEEKIFKDDMLGNNNDVEFNSNLSSIIKFKNIFGENFNKIKNIRTMCEDIIRWHTIFSGEKKMVEIKLEKHYKDILRTAYKTDAEYKNIIGKLKGLSFSGWARFSREFLTEVRVCNIETGERSVSIIDMLKETTMNLMELLNSKLFNPIFIDEIKSKNVNSESKIDYSYVEDLYCSPSVKRSIWQATKIVDEIVKIMGNKKPKKIFIEVTRANEKKDKKTGKGKVTSSRKAQLIALYKKLNTDLKTSLEKCEDKKLRGDKPYLYFCQCGHCAYCNKSIDLDELSNNNLYDIDHIYPQSKIKDDSITNKVLVCRKCNAVKKDIFPLPSTNIQTPMKSTWDFWREKGLMSKEKYSRLIRTTELSEDELLAFVNRQMVNTNQATKEVAKLLDLKFGKDDKRDTKIVYSKAGLVSEFRNKFNIVKCREVNNLHHAKDAYLNIVVGNVWDTKFSSLREIYSKKHKEIYNEQGYLNKLFDATYERWNSESGKKEKCNKEDIGNAWSFGTEKDEQGFLKNHGTFLTVKKYCDENRYLITKRVFEKKGEMFDQTRHMKQKADKEATTILLKETKKENGEILFDPKKYGGFKTLNAAYIVCCKSDIIKEKSITKGDNKGKKEKLKIGEKITLHPIPIMYAHRKEYENDKIHLQELVERLYGLINVEILVDKIPYWSLIEVDDIRYQIRGFGKGIMQLNIAYEWFCDEATTQYVHDIFKYLNLLSENQLTISEEDKKLHSDIEFATRNDKTPICLSKDNNLKLYEEIEEQLKRPFYNLYSSKFVKGDENEKAKFKNSFKNLSTYEQVVTLKELLKFITSNGTIANLKSIGGQSTETCKVILNNDITNKKVKLINQSITGFYESKVVLSDGKNDLSESNN